MWAAEDKACREPCCSRELLTVKYPVRSFWILYEAVSILKYQFPLFVTTQYTHTRSASMGAGKKNASYCASCVRPAQQALVELCPYLFLLSCLGTHRICSYLWNCLLAPIGLTRSSLCSFCVFFFAFLVFVQVSCLVLSVLYVVVVVAVCW